MKDCAKNYIEYAKYYIPIYCYRHSPDVKDIYDYIIDNLVDYKKITIYKNHGDATEAARAMLCDDDCCCVATLDFTNGYCEAYYWKTDDDKIYGARLSNIFPWKDIYDVK